MPGPRDASASSRRPRPPDLQRLALCDMYASRSRAQARPRLVRGSADDGANCAHGRAEKSVGLRGFRLAATISRQITSASGNDRGRDQHGWRVNGLRNAGRPAAYSIVRLASVGVARVRSCEKFAHRGAGSRRAQWRGPDSHQRRFRSRSELTRLSRREGTSEAHRSAAAACFGLRELPCNRGAVRCTPEKAIPRAQGGSPAKP